MQNLTVNKTQSSMSESFLSNFSLMSSASVSMVGIVGKSVGRISNMSISNLRIHRHLRSRLRRLKRTGEWGDECLSSIFIQLLSLLYISFTCVENLDKKIVTGRRQMKCGVYSCAAYEEFSAGLSDDLSKKPGDCSYCRLLGHNME